MNTPVPRSAHHRAADSTARPAFGAFALLLVLLPLLGACRETPRNAVLSPALEAPQPTGPVKATLVIERDPADSASRAPTAMRDYLVTVRLDDAATTRVGSLTAAIDFDSTRARYVGDATPADDALRAVHLDRGRVRIAAASAIGVPAGAIVRLRFATRDTMALRALRLSVSEVHALDAADLTRTLSVSAPTLQLAPRGAGSTP